MMYQDLTGRRFGKLIVIKDVGVGKEGNHRWRCVCDCGNTRVVAGTLLNQGKVKSCGCIQDRERKETVPICCKGCIHRRRLAGYQACHYAIDTGFLRNCAPQDCGHYSKDKKKLEEYLRQEKDLYYEKQRTFKE
jgi:hypothetical protein